MPAQFNNSLYIGQETRGGIQVWIFGDGSTYRHIGYGTAAPVSGTWTTGDFIWDSASSAVVGYRCTAGGTPGTWATIAAGAVSAPVDAQYVALATNGTLTNERVLTAGTNITLTDNGAGNTLVIDAASGATFAAPSVEVLSDASSFDAGSGTDAMRANARLIADTATPGTQVLTDASTAAQGLATTLLRSDARLLLTTAAPSALSITNSNAQGSATSGSRSDHTHGIPNGMALKPTLFPAVYHAGPATSSLTPVNDQCYAFYFGRASRANPTVTIGYYFVSGTLSTITSAEVAIATGAPVFNAGTNLTTRGFTSIAANTTNATYYTVAVTTSGIAYGDDYWVLFAINASNRGAYAGTAANVQFGYALSATTTRPSTMASPTAFGLLSASVVVFSFHCSEA